MMKFTHLTIWGSPDREYDLALYSFILIICSNNVRLGLSHLSLVASSALAPLVFLIHDIASCVHGLGGHGVA